MEYRIFVSTDDINVFDNSGIKVYDAIGLRWWADCSHGLLPIETNNDYAIKKWCEENCKNNVGYSLDRWSIREISRSGTYYFASEEDSVLFKLIWCIE